MKLFMLKFAILLNDGKIGRDILLKENFFLIFLVHKKFEIAYTEMNYQVTRVVSFYGVQFSFNTAHCTQKHPPLNDKIES